MPRTKASWGAGGRLADYLMVGYLALNCPLERVRQTLVDCGAQSQRRRGLPHEVLVYYVMCMCLYRRAAYEEVLRIVVEGLRGVYGEEIGQTLVNKAAISLALAALYHRRWKIEMALGEIKTQLNDSLTLRSKTPVLVEQEFYALLMAHAAFAP